MLFSSPVFFIFFAAYFALHLAVPGRWRIWLIIAGSTIFYGYWNPLFVWVPYVLAFIAYFCGFWIDGAPTASARRTHLYLTITGLLIPLLFFKYTNFIYDDILGPVFGMEGSIVDLPLPLGISFVTFTAISYVTDVYFKRFEVERHLPTMLGYILFFPQLIAGPILRPKELIPQLHRLSREQRKRLAVGFVIFTVGLVKKLVIADQLADWVDPIYASDQAWNASDYLVAIYGFSLQIYCDFSGYTDMAIGLATILGVRLPINFNRPYSAGSIVEFWRCWHITLSNWLKDYLYIALGGNRVVFHRQIINIFITMVLGGLWHGASWTFAIWGAVHGLAIAATHTLRKIGVTSKLPNLPRFVGIFFTFHFVTLAWILFRSPDLDTAWRIVTGPLEVFALSADAAMVNIYPLLLISIALAFHGVDTHRHVRRFIRWAPPAVLWGALFGLWMLSMTVSAGSSADFVYFDF